MEKFTIKSQEAIQEAQRIADKKALIKTVPPGFPVMKPIIRERKNDPVTIYTVILFSLIILEFMI